MWRVCQEKAFAVHEEHRRGTTFVKGHRVKCALDRQMKELFGNSNRGHVRRSLNMAFQETTCDVWKKSVSLGFLFLP